MNKKERLRELKRTVLGGISLEEMKQAKAHFEKHPGTLDLGEDDVSKKRRRIGRAGMLWMYYELDERK